MILKPAIRVCLLLAPLLASILMAASASAPAEPVHPLVWDAMEKIIEVSAEKDETTFQFSVTNRSDKTVEVLEIEPSCGCTVAEMPSTPWVLAPGAKGAFNAVVEHRGKHGRLSKSLLVHSDAGSQELTMILNLRETEESRRARNQQLAFSDRQAVFRGECASCHALPTMNKTGEPLFQAACAICHGAKARADMVPDLMVAREKRDAAYWERWIANGKEQTLMPAFAANHGGPLTAAQIASLVEYALSRFPTEPGKN